jgi:hypothetical protein
MLAEKENTKMLELLEAVAEKVGVPCRDESVSALMEEIEPSKMVEQIMSATGEDTKEIKSNRK